MPEELAYALRVDVSNLRPWEHDACPADLYEEIVYSQNVFAREMKYARDDHQAMEAGKQAAKQARKQR